VLYANQPFDEPFMANDGGGAAVAVTGIAGPVIHVRGVAPGQNDLEIIGRVSDRETIGAATFDAVEFLPSTHESTGAGLPAFASGQLTFGLQMFGTISAQLGRSLVTDTSLTVTGWPGATRPTWNSMQATAVAGTYPLTVTSGSVSLPIDLVVVDHVDSVAASPIEPVQAGTFDVVCFAATTNGRNVFGLSWSFSSSTDPAVVTVTNSPLFPNCADLDIAAHATAPIVVTATAGGVSTTQTFPYD
jgi:hypothetical protein